MELKLTDATDIKVRICCLVILGGGSVDSAGAVFSDVRRTEMSLDKVHSEGILRGG